MPVFRPFAARDQVLLEARDRIAEREVLPVVGGPVLGRVVRGRMRTGAVGHPLDQRRAEVVARAVGGPARGRMDSQKVVAVDAQRGDAGADAARGEGRALAAGDRLEGRDRPLVVDDVDDHRGAIDVGEGQRGVEVGLGRRAVADPAGRDLRVALDRRRHAPADRLRHLRREVAGNAEEAVLAVGVEHRQLAALHRVALVREELAHQLDERHLARHQQALLAIGREVHVAGLERERVGDGDGFLAEALHVERELLLPLGDQHACVEDARLQHRAQAEAQLLRRQFGHPGADGIAVVVEHANQREGKVAGLDGLGVDRRSAHGAGGGKVQVGKIGVLSRPSGGLGHMQPQGRVLTHFTPRVILSCVVVVGRRLADKPVPTE